MFTPARKFWEIRCRENAGQSRIGIAIAILYLKAEDATKTAIKRANQSMGTDGMFAALLVAWAACAVGTVAFLATH